jgi:hypothetical protein
MHSKSGPAIIAACTIVHTMLSARDLTSCLQKLDNEISRALQEFMMDSDIDYQLPPPPYIAVTQQKEQYTL